MIKILSFLGTNEYKLVKYYYGDIEVETRFVQECIYRIVSLREKEKPVLLVGLTKEAGIKNWPELKKVLDDRGYLYECIGISDGKNNTELWNNFETLYSHINPEDKVYFDVTHSFRSIPLLVTSVLNYAKFVKGMEIEEIYYGAFEAKDEENRAPIFNLSAFNQITDWTIASEKFLETGDSRALARILKSEINPILREKKDKDHYAKLVNKVSDKLVCFSSALYTVRGKDIIRYGKQLKEALEAIKDEKNEIMSLVPFNKILNMIYEKVAFYSGDIVLDIHNTVKLCKEFNLVQQAYTLMRENLVTYACVKAGFDVYDKKAREDTAKAISAKEYFDKKVIEIYSDISYIRNDINHGGYRDSSMGADKFREKLDEMINRFEMIINE